MREIAPQADAATIAASARWSSQRRSRCRRSLQPLCQRVIWMDCARNYL